MKKGPIVSFKTMVLIALLVVLLLSLCYLSLQGVKEGFGKKKKKKKKGKKKKKKGKKKN